MKKLLILFLLLSSFVFAKDDEIKIQLKFFIPTDYGTLIDALYIDPDIALLNQINAFILRQQAQIKDLKDSREASFIDHIENPPAPVESTLEELLVEYGRLNQDVLNLEYRMEELGWVKPEDPE